MTAVPSIHAHPDIHLSTTEVSVLFAGREAAERAVARLAHDRLRAEDVATWEPGDARWVRFDDRLGRDLRAARRDALLAGVVGAALLATIALVAIGEAIGSGWALAFGALIGLGFGAFLGAMFGLQTTEPLDDDPAIVVPTDEDARLVTFVTTRPRVARREMERLGGTLVVEEGHNLPLTE